MPRSSRKSLNQSLFREVNETMAELPSLRPDSEPREFICECAEVGCTELISLMPSAYREVRGDPTLFLVLRGHEDPDRETVVTEHDIYLVVRVETAAEQGRRT
jgi:hypothetical protein